MSAMRDTATVLYAIGARGEKEMNTYLCDEEKEKE
jgi:hypothetical protein